MSVYCKSRFTRGRHAALGIAGGRVANVRKPVWPGMVVSGIPVSTSRGFSSIAAFLPGRASPSALPSDGGGWKHSRPLAGTRSESVPVG